MSNAISEALTGAIKGGLSSIATKIFSSITGFKQALRVVTRAQTALVSPIAGVFKRHELFGFKSGQFFTGCS